VLERLGAVLIAKPGIALFSRSPVHFEHVAGPIDGADLIAACAVVLGHRAKACVGLFERARLEANGESVRDFCRERGYSTARRCFI
jgi:hypothetical protein